MRKKNCANNRLIIMIDLNNKQMEECEYTYLYQKADTVTNKYQKRHSNLIC